MKIIFDDKYEKDFFVRKLCPIDILKETNMDCYGYEGSPDKCKQCWEKNVEMEVRENVKD